MGNTVSCISIPDNENPPFHEKTRTSQAQKKETKNFQEVPNRFLLRAQEIPQNAFQKVPSNTRRPRRPKTIGTILNTTLNYKPGYNIDTHIHSQSKNDIVKREANKRVYKIPEKIETAPYNKTRKEEEKEKALHIADANHSSTQDNIQRTKDVCDNLDIAYHLASPNTHSAKSKTVTANSFDVESMSKNRTKEARSSCKGLINLNAIQSTSSPKTNKASKLAAPKSRSSRIVHVSKAVNLQDREQLTDLSKPTAREQLESQMFLPQINTKNSFTNPEKLSVHNISLERREIPITIIETKNPIPKSARISKLDKKSVLKSNRSENAPKECKLSENTHFKCIGDDKPTECVQTDSISNPPSKHTSGVHMQTRKSNNEKSLDTDQCQTTETHNNVQATFNLIVDKSNLLAEKVKLFEKLDDNNDYYFIEESLKQLIDQLDSMYDLIKNSPLLRARRKAIYKHIFGLFEELDERVEVNKVKFIFSSMRNEVRKIEEELMLFEKLSEKDKKQKETVLEKMIAQLDKICDHIKENQHLLNEKESLLTRLSNLLNKFRKNESKTNIDGRIEISNQPVRVKLEDKVFDNHTENFTKLISMENTVQVSKPKSSNDVLSQTKNIDVSVRYKLNDQVVIECLNVRQPEIVDLDEKFEETFRLIIEKSNRLAVYVKSFEKLDDCNDYYFIEESLKQLIDQLDAMYDLIKDSPLLRAKQKGVYKFIYGLIEELDEKVKVNKVKLTLSFMRNEASKLEEELMLFDNFNEREKKQNEKRLEAMLAQLNQIYYQIKYNKELVNEKEVLYSRLCNLLNKLRKNETKIEMDKGIEVTNPLDRIKLVDKVSEKHNPHLSELSSMVDKNISDLTVKVQQLEHSASNEECLDQPNIMKLHKEVERTFSLIIEKSKGLAVYVRNFIKLEDSNDYHFIEESLKQLIDQLDAIYDLVKNSPLLRARRKTIYRYIFELIEELDKKVELNKIKSIYSSIQNEVGKLEEALYLFDNLNETEKYHHKKHTEELIAQLNTTNDQIKSDAELLTEKQLLDFRLFNILDKLREKENQQILDKKIKLRNMLQGIRLKGQFFENYIVNFTETSESNQYYLIEENVLELICLLDNMYDDVVGDENLKKERKEIYTYLFGLHDKLDEKVECNKSALVKFS